MIPYQKFRRHLITHCYLVIKYTSKYIRITIFLLLNFVFEFTRLSISNDKQINYYRKVCFNDPTLKTKQKKL